MCGLSKQNFKEETNEHGQYNLAVIDEFGNTFFHEAALDESPINQEVVFYCFLIGKYIAFNQFAPRWTP